MIRLNDAGFFGKGISGLALLRSILNYDSFVNNNEPFVFWINMLCVKRRKRLRLKDYDYSQPGAYFVTICTKDRENRFGEIVDGKMRENETAIVVHSCWNELPNHYPNVELDAFVVMPNHVHGIIMILDEPVTVGNCTVADGLRPSATRPSPAGQSPAKKYPLSEIVRAFKSFSARRINEKQNTPGTPVWQRGYYDHIIRNDRSLARIRQYIARNPLRWTMDHQDPDTPRIEKRESTASQIKPN